MCSRNLFCLKGWKREEKHVDWSCAMEIICFVLRGNTWIGHVQWKCFFGKKKSRDTLWLFMCSGNCFFFWEEKKAEKRVDWSCAVDICFFAGKKQRNKYINHVQWNLFKRKRVVWSCAVDICFLAENMWIQHVLDVASSLAVLKPQCQGWNNRRPNQIWKTRCLLPIARTKYY